MLDDGDTVLHLVGALLALAVVGGLVVLGLSFANPSDDAAPDAEWDVERINGSHVEVTHAGGEAVRTEELRITVDDIERSPDWSDPVREGDAAVALASEGTLLRVVWRGGRGDRTVLRRERV